MRRQMLSLFDAPGDSQAYGEPAAGVFPPVNVTQDEGSFHVRAEIPGFKTSDLSISVVKNRLTLAGKRELQREHERSSYHRRERADGAFNRTMTLPVEVDAARVEARYTDGILSLTLPKAEAAKPRQIVVKT
jgi:HSP20 family protein